MAKLFYSSRDNEEKNTKGKEEEGKKELGHSKVALGKSCQGCGLYAEIDEKENNYKRDDEHEVVQKKIGKCVEFKNWVTKDKYNGRQINLAGAD